MPIKNHRELFLAVKAGMKIQTKSLKIDIIILPNGIIMQKTKPEEVKK